MSTGLAYSCVFRLDVRSNSVDTDSAIRVTAARCSGLTSSPAVCGSHTRAVGTNDAPGYARARNFGGEIPG